MGNYQSLQVWRDGVELALEVYSLTEKFPRDERFGLTSQMRRAAVSVPSNIAEGESRRSRRDFAHFVDQASGSVAELETQLIIAARLGWVSVESADAVHKRSAGIGKMLNGLRRYLRSKAQQPSRRVSPAVRR